MKRTVIAAALIGAVFNLSAKGGVDNAVGVSDSPISVEFSKIGIEVRSITPSPIKGLNQVITDKGVLYASDDGQFLLQGTFLDVKNKVNLTEQALSGVRLEGIKQFNDSMIVYPAKDEKHKITVFTDITCGYCRKLHRELEEFHDAGITVQYLAYPRSGVPSQGYNDLQNIWCAKDAAKALTEAKAGAAVRKADSCNAPVKEQFEFGVSLGLSGTPAIILEDGTLIPGYQPAAQIKAYLEAGKG